jgi:hypothetical protein
MEVHLSGADGYRCNTVPDEPDEGDEGSDETPEAPPDERNAPRIQDPPPRGEEKKGPYAVCA